jgi:PDZ domain-containing protein
LKKLGITPFRVVVGLVVALLITFVILERTSSNYYLLYPDVAHPVAPLVRVAAKPATDTGELFFVDVQERRATEFDRLFHSWFHPHSTLVQANLIVPPGQTDQEVVKAELHMMATSKQLAAGAAERQLGYPVTAGTLISSVDRKTHAFGKLKKGDIIDSVNGKRVVTLGDLHTLLDRVRPGAVVALGLLRGGKQQTVSVQTLVRKGRALVGILVEQARPKIPKKVAIATGNIGGPSAGLAFTLEVMRRLGYDVTHGYKVAATGTMDLDGNVGPIGGVEQKTWGVRDAGAQVFLVPAGENARIAKKNAGPNLKVIPVTSLKQALDALAALPKLPKE